MSRRSLRRSLPTLALLIACILLVVLSFRVRGTERELREASRNARILPVGTYTTPVKVSTTGGDSLTVGEPGQVQVLFFLTTTCPFCLESIPAWKQVAMGASALGVRAMVVSMDSARATKEYLERHGLTVPAGLFEDPRHRSYYRVGSVPRTVAIDRLGRTIYSRAAVMTLAAADSLLAILRPFAESAAAAASPAQGASPPER